MRALLYIGFILGALLFTPQGHDIAELILGSYLNPRPAVTSPKTDAEIAACKTTWNATHPHGYYDHVPYC
jgi:hypothetical protein